MTRILPQKRWATILLDECNKLYGYKPGDDTTVSVMKVRQRRAVNLMHWAPGRTGG